MKYIGILALVGFGYILGSIPFGYLAGKLLKDVDVRTKGSGNIGATNILRTLGLGPALVVLCCDLGKGALAAYLGYPGPRDFRRCTVRRCSLVRRSILCVFGVSRWKRHRSRRRDYPCYNA